MQIDIDDNKVAIIYDFHMNFLKYMSMKGVH